MVIEIKYFFLILIKINNHQLIYLLVYNNQMSTRKILLNHKIDQILDLFIVKMLLFSKSYLPRSVDERMAILLLKKDYIKSILGLIVFNSIGGVITLYLQFFIANKVGVISFGEYSYYVAIGTVGAVFTRYGRNKTMLRDIIQSENNTSSIIISTFIIGIANMLFFNIVIILLQRILDYEFSLISFLIINGTMISSLDFQPFYESQNRFSFHSLIMFAQKFLFISIVLLWYFMCGDLTILIVGFALFFSWLFMIIAEFIDIKSFISFNLSINDVFSLTYDTYKKNFYVAASTIVGIAFGPILRIILKNEYGDTEVGIFSASFQILILSEFLMNQISRIGNPLMATSALMIESNLSDVRRKVFLYLFVVLISVFPFSLLMIFMPVTLTHFMLSDEYSSVSVLLPILGVYLIFLSVGVVFAQFLISLRMDACYIKGYVFGGIMTAVVGWILIKPFGVLGATIALGLSHSISCIIYVYYSLKILFR